MTQYERAKLIATLAHDGQLDKGGVPYFEHCQRVVRNIREWYGTNVMWVMGPQLKSSPLDDLLAVAYLHDVVEDTEWTLEDLRRLGKFSDEVIDAVDAMTQRYVNEWGTWGHSQIDGSWREPLEEYWARVKANPMARLVKVYGDIPDNNDPARQEIFTPEKREKMRAKYARALEFLS